jgi:metal-responsive CopG/Arc/MetJ family transcriptional regulator
MSSKKIGVSFWIDKVLLMKVDDEAVEDNRSRSNLVEQILKERYESKEGSTKGEKQNGAEA